MTIQETTGTHVHDDSEVTESTERPVVTAADDEFLTVGELLEAIGRQTGLPIPSLRPELAEMMLYIEASGGEVVSAVRSLEEAYGPNRFGPGPGVCYLGLGPMDGYTMVPVPEEFEPAVFAMVDASERAHRWEAERLQKAWDELWALRAAVAGLLSASEVV